MQTAAHALTQQFLAWVAEANRVNVGRGEGVPQ